jgi:PAS domain S-box-containing protein
MSEDSPTRDELLRENRRLRASLAAEREADADVDFLREAFQLGPAAMVVSRLFDGALIEANEEFCRLTGYAYEELMERSTLELGLWPSERTRRVALKRLRSRGEILGVEFALRGKNGRDRSMLGSCRRLDNDGEECMLVSCIDVTERRHAEASERESSELFRRLFRLSPAGLALVRLDDGRLTDVNPEFCRLSGYERSHLVGSTAMEMDLWKDDERRLRLVKRLASEGVVHDFEFTLLAADGWPVELMGSFQLIDIGGERMVLSVLSDISARKRTEESLRRAKKEAEDLAQFRSTVISNITHEVRTPLTVILGFTSILREGIDGPHRRFVDLIERSGRRLLLTLDTVLDLAQLESGTLDTEVRRQNILDIVDSIASTSRFFAEEKGLTFETDLPARALYVEVDYELLARALGHLVDNAIKFTDEGDVTLRVRVEGEKVLVEVQDTGIGIEENFVPELFNVFAQESSGMNRDYQGSGMGLPVTGRLVEHFGGEVRVESRKGAGSTFTVALPKAKSVQKNTAFRASAA